MAATVNRGGDAWELKFPATDPATGHRKVRYVTFKGSETAARAELRKLVRAADDGAFVAPARQTFGTVLDAWDKTLTVSPKTAERYRELVKLHIRPHLGELKLQAIRPTRVEALYNDLRAGIGPDGKGKGRALAPRTIGHIHRLMVKILARRRARRPDPSPTRPGAPSGRRSSGPRSRSSARAKSARCLTKLRGRAMFLLAAVGLSPACAAERC